MYGVGYICMYPLTVEMRSWEREFVDVISVGKPSRNENGSMCIEIFNRGRVPPYIIVLRLLNHLLHRRNGTVAQPKLGAVALCYVLGMHNPSSLSHLPLLQYLRTLMDLSHPRSLSHSIYLLQRPRIPLLLLARRVKARRHHGPRVSLPPPHLLLLRLLVHLLRPLLHRLRQAQVLPHLVHPPQGPGLRAFRPGMEQQPALRAHYVAARVVVHQCGVRVAAMTNAIRHMKFIFVREDGRVLELNRIWEDDVLFIGEILLGSHHWLHRRLGH
ncbi:Transcription initiation factor IIB-2 [Senna tora]|uniref:Transcription initiation factor IIB-2 n=1 Tax=Senna tora TaxID=362788 RepID=A0A834TKE8_9FABA|nr:Transcription initiation factor IIB-2 [Senna tora]